MKYVLGIDPGTNGAAALIDPHGRYIFDLKFVDSTRHDIAEFVKECTSLAKGNGYEIIAYLEQVHSMPKQGVSSTFKFGTEFGFVIGLLTATKIPYEFITPAKWQDALKCRTKGDKNITKSAAQRLFPTLKITHGNADAILIAVYGHKKENGNL